MTAMPTSARPQQNARGMAPEGARPAFQPGSIGAPSRRGLSDPAERVAPNPTSSNFNDDIAHRFTDRTASSRANSCRDDVTRSAKRCNRSSTP